MATTSINKLERHHIEALNRWIDSHGRQWKSELRHAWFCGTYRGLTPGRDHDEATLQNLRYRLGPAGLETLTAPQIRKAMHS